MNLACVTCHFNFAGYDMPARNLRRFLRQMDRCGMPVYGVELYLRGREPEMAGQPGWQCHEVGEEAILWQKEALLNMAERMVPERFRFVCAIDADVEFANPYWVRQTERALESAPVAQLFGTALWTDRRGAVCRKRPSVCKSGLDMDRWTTHPGFAWGFDRSVYRAMGGWYDVAPLGAGDTLLCVALRKQPVPDRWMEHAYGYLGPKNRSHFDAWMAGVRIAMHGRSVGYVPGDLIHEWHGDIENRRYGDRHVFIEGYDADTHIRKAVAGYLQWTPSAPERLKQNMQDYFLGRDEDGNNHRK